MLWGDGAHGRTSGGDPQAVPVVSGMEVRPEVPSDAAPCFSCKGEGVRRKRERNSARSKGQTVCVCKPCDGRGFILRTKRRNPDGTWRKKALPKSFPSFNAPGEAPHAERFGIPFVVESDEELCYLVCPRHCSLHYMICIY